MSSITIDAKWLADALAAVKPAVNTRSTVAAYAGVRLDTNGPVPLMFAGGNPYNGMVRRALLGVSSTPGMNLVVDHSELVKVAKSFKGEIALDVDGDKLKCANSAGKKITLRTLNQDPWEDWVEQVGQELVIESQAGALRTAILKANKFRSRDETRPLLTGIRLDKGLLVSTDSYRLEMIKCPGATGEHEVTFDGRFLGLAAANMPKGIELVSVYTGAVFSTVTYGNMAWLSRNIDGQYPNWKQLMPEEGKFNGAITAPVAELLEGAKLGKDFLAKNSPIRIKVEKNGRERAFLHGSSPDGPRFEQEITGAVVTIDRNAMDKNAIIGAEPFELGANPDFMTEALASLGCETARIRFITPLRPFLIENPDHDDEKHLLMPIRLNV